MKTRTKLLFVLIVVLIVVVGTVSFAVKREMRTYHNQELVKLVYEYWEFENLEIKRVGEKAAKVLLPQMMCEAPGLFQGRRFYFCLEDFEGTGKYIDLLVESEEGRVFKPFIVGYDVFKPPSDIIRYDWCSIRSSYVDCDFFDSQSQYNDLKSKEEKKIRKRKKSEEILKIAEKKFSKSLDVYNKRKQQEEEFLQVSQKLGPKILQVNEVLDNHMKTIKSSIKTFKGYYSFTISSERFKRVSCTFFYDPDPDFKIVRIELGEVPGKKCFDVGYERDYELDCTWGLINNENATLESFGVLLDVLDLIEIKITKEPEILKATVSVR